MTSDTAGVAGSAPGRRRYHSLLTVESPLTVESSFVRPGSTGHRWREVARIHRDVWVRTMAGERSVTGDRWTMVNRAGISASNA
jgi:hypothetical protein